VGARIGLTFDCADAVKLGEFWKLALGYEDKPPPEPYTSVEEWLREVGGGHCEGRPAHRGGSDHALGEQPAWRHDG